MRIFWLILNFYKKLIIPTLGSSLAITFFSLVYEYSFTEIFGLSYIFMAVLFHFFTYEVTYPNEYYFYYNLGLSKIILYATTFIISFIIGIIIYNL